MGRIKKTIKRLDKKTIKKFKEIPTTILSDVQNRSMTMSSKIRPLIDNKRIVGQAITVNEMAGCNIMLHQSLTIAQKGDILVANVRGHTNTSVWGGIMTKVAKKIGVEGLIVNGSIRDLDEVKKLSFPVYCKGIVPAGPHKGFAGEINYKISCAGVQVEPGDLIVADIDGVVVIPFKKIDSVYRNAKKSLEKEKEWLKNIDSGMSTIEAIGLEKHLDNLDIDIED